MAVTERIENDRLQNNRTADADGIHRQPVPSEFEFIAREECQEQRDGKQQPMRQEQQQRFLVQAAKRHLRIGEEEVHNCTTGNILNRPVPP